MIFAPLDCEDTKPSFWFFASLEAPAFLCYCTVIKLPYGMRHLRLCYGKSGVKLIRRAGLTVWVGCVGSHVGTLQLTGAVKELWSQQ